MDKSYYRKQFKIILICVILVSLIVLLKALNIKPANNAIKLIEKTLNYNISLDSSKKLLGFINGIEDYEDYAVPVFKTSDISQIITDNITPVRGTIFKNYGEIKKSNTEIEFYNGIDIIVNSEKVINIDNGKVSKIGHNKFGKFVKIISENYTYVYSGLDNIFVSEGEYVVKGQQIGNFTDIDKKIKKLHFEIWKGSKSINPLEILDFTSSGYEN